MSERVSEQKRKIVITTLTVVLIAVTLSILIMPYFLKTTKINHVAINKQNTEYALENIERINAVTININPKEDIFYWLFPSDTLQVSRGLFTQLAKNLNITEIYYKTDSDWNSQFGFYIFGETRWDRITVLHWVNGTQWSFD